MLPISKSKTQNMYELFVLKVLHGDLTARYALSLLVDRGIVKVATFGLPRLLYHHQ